MERTYTGFSNDGFSGYCSPKLSMDSISDFIAKIPSFTAEKNCLRIDGTGTRYSFKCRIRGIDSSLYLKVVHLNNPLRYLFTKVMSCSLANISAGGAMELSKRGIETPPVYLVLVKKTGPLSEISYIVTKEAEPFTFIEPFIHRGYETASEAGSGIVSPKCHRNSSSVVAKATRIKAWAEFVKGMHDSGCYHFDLSNYNVMTRPDLKDRPIFELIDLDMVVTNSPGKGLWNSLFSFVELVIMNAMFKNKDFRRIDKLRFLKAYWGEKSFKFQMKRSFIRFFFNRGELGRNKWFRRVFFNLFRIIRLAGVVNSKVQVEGEQCHLNQA